MRYIWIFVVLYPLAWAISRTLCPVAASLICFFLLADTDGFTSLIDGHVLILFLWIMSENFLVRSKNLSFMNTLYNWRPFDSTLNIPSLTSVAWFPEIWYCGVISLFSFSAIWNEFSYTSLYYIMFCILDFLAFVSASLNTWLTVGA